MLKKIRFLYPLLAVVILLAACAPVSVSDDGSKIDATQAAQMIEDAVAKALADAQATADAAAAAAPQPTATLATIEEAPTATPVPVQPTLTPFPTVTPYVIAPSSGGTTTTYTPEYDCTMTVRKPADNTVLRPNDDFDINWTLKNTGTATWAAGTDINYNAGPSLSATTFLQITGAVAPGESVSFILDATAPSKEGSYIMNWKIQGGFCYPYMAIIVKAK